MTYLQGIQLFLKIRIIRTSTIFRWMKTILLWRNIVLRKQVFGFPETDNILGEIHLGLVKGLGHGRRNQHFEYQMCLNCTLTLSTQIASWTSQILSRI